MRTLKEMRDEFPQSFEPGQNVVFFGEEGYLLPLHAYIVKEVTPKGNLLILGEPNGLPFMPSFFMDIKEYLEVCVQVDALVYQI